ncbi:hypothetical protein D3C78_1621890 [compost metagenome]
MVLKQNGLVEFHFGAGVGDDQLPILFGQQIAPRADHDQPLDANRQTRLRLDQVKLQLRMLGTGAHPLPHEGPGGRLVLAGMSLGGHDRGRAHSQGRDQSADKGTPPHLVSLHCRDVSPE